MYIKLFFLVCTVMAFTSARPQQLPLSLVPPIQQGFVAPPQNNAINPSINSISKPTNPIVVAAFQRDALLPPHMQNAFYKNPKIAEHLAQNSWFGPGEQHAVDRETEKIPREKIFLILKNAGLLPSP
ncbi:unnamed protein product [Aphis gossypii]|uniref:Uncharacterized protein n=1 Tax=Aphis gossypii TaxID=80765 RepID=A0A9P0NG56_APHGO|nr:unnamed protein product [Aphis gossypii]